MPLNRKCLINYTWKLSLSSESTESVSLARPDASVEVEVDVEVPVEAGTGHLILGGLRASLHLWFTFMIIWEGPTPLKRWQTLAENVSLECHHGVIYNCLLFLYNEVNPRALIG